VVEVDCDGDCGARGGEGGGADEEAVGCVDGPGEDLDYEGGALAFGGADYGDDLFEVIAGFWLLVRFGFRVFVFWRMEIFLTRLRRRLRSRLLRLL
jgi:hypothetical protein